MPDKAVEIFTDGACSGNPGPGGWGAVLRYGEHREGAVRRRDGDDKQPHGADGGDRRARSAEAAVPGALYTDSIYLRDGITKWLPNWKSRGWKTAAKEPVKNVDLWQRLEAAAAPHEIEWHWVRGHAGHPENERADALARQGVAQARNGEHSSLNLVIARSVATKQSSLWTHWIASLRSQ